MRQTLVFMRNSAIRGTLIPIFQQFTASIKKKISLEERLGTRLKFCEVLGLF